MTAPRGDSSKGLLRASNRYHNDPPRPTRTRVAIRAEVEGNRPIPDDVLQHIAQGVTSNIRELEGSLIKLLAFASMTGQPVNLQTAEEALQEFLRPHGREVRIAQIQKVVAGEFGISVEAMKSKSRTQRIVFPRQVAVYLARIERATCQIGSLGGRDHTTISTLWKIRVPLPRIILRTLEV